MVKRKLGRGLGSLLENALDETGKVIELDISKIHPNPWQPRRQFDFKSLEDLAASIKEKGLIQPTLSMSSSPASAVCGRRTSQGSRRCRRSFLPMMTDPWQRWR